MISALHNNDNEALYYKVAEVLRHDFSIPQNRLQQRLELISKKQPELSVFDCLIQYLEELSLLQSENLPKKKKLRVMIRDTRKALGMNIQEDTNKLHQIVIDMAQAEHKYNMQIQISTTDGCTVCKQFNGFMQYPEEKLLFDMNNCSNPEGCCASFKARPEKDHLGEMVKRKQPERFPWLKKLFKQGTTFR